MRDKNIDCSLSSCTCGVSSQQVSTVINAALQKGAVGSERYVCTNEAMRVLKDILSVRNQHLSVLNRVA